MKIPLSLFLIFISCCSGTCNKNPFFESVLPLYIKNETNKALIIHVSELYPDTSIVSNYSAVFGAPPNSTVSKDFKDDDWSEVFSRTAKDTLSVFVFSGDTVATYSWSEIRAGYKVLRRYDLSQTDLERMNYIVTYP